jgi:hypothetical protein
VANNQDYITTLQYVIWRTHRAESTHSTTVHVHETFRGKTVLEGDVEVFDLINHPKAKHVYAWAYIHGKKGEETTYVTVLEIPPVKDAKTAVQASIMADSQKPQS